MSKMTTKPSEIHWNSKKSAKLYLLLEKYKILKFPQYMKKVEICKIII